MNRKITGLLVLSLLLLGIQFIQPDRNQSGQVLAADINRKYKVPVNVYAILKNSCYDCHSNNTVYPWYANVQPFGWLLASHIKKGKAELNFSEFGVYSFRRQQNKLKAIKNSIEDDSMPLPSYTLIHTNARLSKKNKELVFDWVKRIQDSLQKD